MNHLPVQKLLDAEHAVFLPIFPGTLTSFFDFPQFWISFFLQLHDLQHTSGHFLVVGISGRVVDFVLYTEIYMIYIWSEINHARENAQTLSGV